MMIDDRYNRLLFALILIGFIILAAFFVALCDSKPGEIAGALGNVVGGTIGALGAAAAVYLTLRAQREDESEKATRAIMSEVSEFAKYPIGQLGACGKIQTGEITVPKSALPTLMHTPEPTIYPAIADRVSRLPRPTLVVSFYNRLQETRGVVAVIVNSPPLTGLTTPQHIKGLADLLISQCQLARLILAQELGGNETPLAADMRQEMIRSIDEQLLIARKFFPDAESFEPGNEPGTFGSVGLRKA